ncbi:MAG: hypothetical protein ACK4S3_08980 [Parvibaculum sp.]
MSSSDPIWKRALGVFKSQWLASVLLIPLGFALFNSHLASEAAKEARAQSVGIERVSRIQESGKALDIALAGYFQSVAEVGMAERKLQMPGTYAPIPLEKAQADVVQARTVAREALVEHASDVQSLRGTLDQAKATEYISELAEMSDVVERPAEIQQTGANITALGKLVVARNSLVDEAMKKVS